MNRLPEGSLKENISCCGLDCAICPVYLATKVNSDSMRRDVAASWSKAFGMKLSVDDINCDGCKTKTGILFGHCRNCIIRDCSDEHKVDNCACCPDYSCRKLDSFLKTFPIRDAREKLERIRVTHIS